MISGKHVTKDFDNFTTGQVFGSLHPGVDVLKHQKRRPLRTDGFLLFRFSNQKFGKQETDESMDIAQFNICFRFWLGHSEKYVNISNQNLVSRKLTSQWKQLGLIFVSGFNSDTPENILTVPHRASS
jgi:hypothetical protein